MASDDGAAGAAEVGAALGARAQLRDWAARGDLVELLRPLSRAGWLAAIGDGIALDDLGTLTGTPRERAGLVVQMLAAAGVATVESGTVRLTGPWAALLSGPSGVGLDVVLDDLDARRDVMRRVLDPERAAVPPLAVAADWGLEATPAAEVLYRSIYDAVPAMRDVLRDGGAFLDVGSGVGGNLITTALLFPASSATGIERAPDVAAELERRVAAAGVADRDSVQAIDAREIDADGAFDCAYWAQEFFAPEVRADVLAVIRRALRPGGLLLLQELLPASDGPADVGRAPDELFGATIGASFGVTAAGLQREAEAAGLVHDSTVASVAGRMVLMRRPD